jgi:hypothetical protein
MSSVLGAGERPAAVLIAGVVLLAAAATWPGRRMRPRLDALAFAQAGRARTAAIGAAGQGPRWLRSRPPPDRRTSQPGRRQRLAARDEVSGCPGG